MYWYHTQQTCEMDITHTINSKYKFKISGVIKRYSTLTHIAYIIQYINTTMRT